MQNGSKIDVIADTNVYFMSLWNPIGKAAKLIISATDEKVYLFSPDTVKEELIRLLKRKGFSEHEIEDIIPHLPVTWIDKPIYEKFMKASALIKHKPDRPILAAALVVGCGIISANRKHFLPARKLVKIWKIDELLEKIQSE